MKTVLLPENILEQVQNDLANLRYQLEDFIKRFNQSNHEILTRAEVAEMFDIDLSTIHNWCKSGKLKPYGIGSRVYFKKSDLDESLRPLR